MSAPRPNPTDAATVVVATRNRRGRLRDCLGGLSSLPERPEIIVVDNGSDDGTHHHVRREFPSVRLVRLTENRGAVARNIGVRLARTAAVAFADDDSGWEPGSLASALAHLRAHPRLALIAARTLVGPHRGLDEVSRFMAAAPLGWEPDLPGPSVLGFLSCSAIVRRDAFLRAGGFDPIVFFMGEEERVAYDLARLGWGLAYCDDVVALHHPDPAQPARALVAARNSALTAWMRRPIRVALNRSAALCAKASEGAEARRAIIDLLRRLPAALAARQRPEPAVEARLRVLKRAARWTNVPSGQPADAAQNPNAISPAAV